MSNKICKCGHYENEHESMLDYPLACFHKDVGETYCDCMAFTEDVEATTQAHLKQIEANYDALQSPMPCGHLARYAVNEEDGTQYCSLCALEADKQTIANLVMVDVEETNEKCPFCQTRAILTRVGELLDLTPEIGSPHYDDVIADLINDVSSANSTFQCYCEETKHE